MIAGQDWASYQSVNPNVAGLDFVAIKVTQGLTYVNPHWHAQYDWATDHGLAVLLYHYPNMHNGAGVELQHFLSVARERPLPGVGLVLDWEGYDPSNQGLTHADLAAYKEGWLHQAAAAMPHNRHVLYCNVDYWRNVDATGHCGDGLWIADPGAPAGNPGIRAPWVMHQYSDVGGIDRDVANFPNRAALQAWLDHTTPEVDMPLTQADADLVAQTLTAPGNRDAFALATLYWLDKTLAGQPLPDTVPAGLAAACERLRGSFDNAVKAAVADALAIKH